MRRALIVTALALCAALTPVSAWANPAAFGAAVKAAMNRAMRSLAQRTMNRFFEHQLTSLSQRRLLSTMHRDSTRQSLAQMVAREQARQRQTNASGTLLARSLRSNPRQISATTGGFGSYVAEPPNLVSRPSQLRRMSGLRLSRKKLPTAKTLEVTGPKVGRPRTSFERRTTRRGHRAPGFGRRHGRRHGR